MTMNKNLLFGLGMMAFLASCSSDESLIAPADDNTTTTITNSDVEIKLSSGSKTRASIESTPSGVFAVDGLGIYCLAKNNINRNPNELPIQWLAGTREGQYSVWMNNVKSNAVINVDNVTHDSTTNIVWADNETRYYPVGNWHAYRFYGYYPHTESIINDGNSFVASHELDGMTDIIWGRTSNMVDTLGDLAYSAKYFRQLEHASEVPSISFKHKLMRLTFSMVAGPDANGSTESAKTMGVKSITINDVPFQSNLTIADRNNPANDGKVEFNWDDVRNLELPDSNDVVPLRTDYYWVKDTEVTIGQGILLPVIPDGNDHKYTISIVLVNKDGIEFPAEYPMDIRFAGSERFVEGKSYNIKLTINGPKAISLDATLTPWEIDDTTLAGDGIEL